MASFLGALSIGVHVRMIKYPMPEANVYLIADDGVKGSQTGQAANPSIHTNICSIINNEIFFMDVYSPNFFGDFFLHGNDVSILVHASIFIFSD